MAGKHTTFMKRVSFESDYNNGTLPEILSRLIAENDNKTSGYGSDPYTASAKEKIRQAIGCPEADIFFLIGGTQTNQTVIDALVDGKFPSDHYGIYSEIEF